MRSLKIILALLTIWLVASCTLAPPFNRLLPEENEVAEATVETPTPRPTFTSTPAQTPTPTNTSTPTVTPIPSETPTPEATETPTAEPTLPPTNTRPPPPPPTETPIPPPTEPPPPSWQYRVGEFYSYPTQANILSIMIAVQETVGGKWIPGVRVVGRDPNGNVTKTEFSADHSIGYTPADAQVVKAGNIKFEPQPVAVYITGAWQFYLESSDGQQLSETLTLNMDEVNREWYFIMFVPN